jgi:hypothetical protein
MITRTEKIYDHRNIRGVSIKEKFNKTERRGVTARTVTGGTISDEIGPF